MNAGRMIEVSHLSKWYGDFRAVHELGFEVARGEVVGFLGPNGAGKSTTLRILAGYLGATSGDVRIDGVSILDEPERAREHIGYMPETCPLYVEMRVSEYLAFRAELKGVPGKKRRSAVEKAMDDARLGGFEDTTIQHLSKGYRQRVGIADALVASPPLLILDEPTAGLDPNQIREVRDLIRRLAGQHTVLLSTHILSEVDATCTRGVVIAKGQLVASGTLDELRALRRAGSVRVRVRPAKGAREAVEAVPGVTSVEDEPGAPPGQERWRVSLQDPERGDETIEAVVQALGAAGAGVFELVPQASLEEVFSQVTGAEGAR